MASLYAKGGTTTIWIRYKDEHGKWKGKPTAYKWDNIGDVRQAKLLARRQSEKEAEYKSTAGEKLSEWVLPWIISRYGSEKTSTPDNYKRWWRNLQKYLAVAKIETAGQIKRDFIEQYLTWRTVTGGRHNIASRNTAIQEIKLLAMILDEAVNRNHCENNPLKKPRLKKDAPKEKTVWSDEDMLTAAKHIEREKSQWMRVAFYFGLYQACRLRQCQLPLSAIRFDLGVIQYPDKLVKGRHGYSQPIDPAFVPILKQLVKEAQDAKQTTLCKVPWDASMRFRTTFNRCNLPNLSHHGLRVTWITRAAEKGVPESQAMAFCHHESREVHRIYKKLSVIEIAHVPALLKLPDLAFLQKPS